MLLEATFDLSNIECNIRHIAGVYKWNMIYISRKVDL